MNKKIIYILSLVFLASNIIGSAEARNTRKKTQEFEGGYSYVESIGDNDITTTTKNKKSKNKKNKKKKNQEEDTPKKIYNQLVSKFNQVKNNLKKDKKKVSTKSSQKSTDQLKLENCYKKMSKDCGYFYKQYKADSRLIKKNKFTDAQIKTQLEKLYTAVNGHRNSSLLNELRNSTDAKVKAAAENAYNQLSTLATEIETSIQKINSQVSKISSESL